MMSPSGVLISSPTMTRTPRFWPAALTAAEISLWSVMHTTSRLSRAARSASSVQRGHRVPGRDRVQVAVDADQAHRGASSASSSWE